jgi:hypothetical protein
VFSQHQNGAGLFYDDQVLDHLNEAMISFVKWMELAFIATGIAEMGCW